MAVFKKINNHIKHLIIYFLSFCINYLIFVLFMLFVSKNSVIGINIVNIISWILSMLFIFYIDKKYVPDLVDENNSKELIKFILIRVFGLILEGLIIFIFIIILRNNYYIVKLISLILLFILNEFYIRNFKYKE